MPWQRRVRQAGPMAVAVLAAVAVRIVVLGFESGDYQHFIKPWYDFIATHGGFAALAHRFSDYNVPYLYLLALLTYLPVPALVGVKIISVAFDLVLAYFVHRIVALRHGGSRLPSLAAVVVLFLPTVAVNSGMWGQADAIYAAFGVGGVYFVLRRRPWLAGAFFGLSLAFKLQAVFLFPLLLALVLKKWMPWRTLLAVPATVALAAVPALAVGAPLGELLSVYVHQTAEYTALTLNAPSIYQFLPADADAAVIRPLGVGVAGVVVLGLCLAVGLSRERLTVPRVVLMAAATALLVPFLLPSMHERYFYVAEVLTVVAAFHRPRLWYVPVLVQVASSLAYLHVLLPPSGPRSAEFAPTAEFRVLAALMAVACASLLWATFQEFRRPVTQACPGLESPSEAAPPSSSAVEPGATADPSPVRRSGCTPPAARCRTGRRGTRQRGR
ncbi:hypothetical protein ACQEVB_18565 [Pseudonocardia sp. CA-107938]|uniref:hypothetical protein n=1 Tax=Pseudonocardia sp. CA-107938 TaxID=3240021 RepID=UPI003D89DF1C